MPRGSKPGERRGGRKKGTPNKVTTEVKEMVIQALSDAGGVNYLKTQAEENPNAFMGLVGKVLPLQAHVEHGASQTLADLLIAVMKGRAA